MNNIIVAFPKQETAQNLKKILLQNGFHVDAVCSTGSQHCRVPMNWVGALSFVATDLWI